MIVTSENITSKQRSKLKALASQMAPITQIGKGGITDNMLEQIGNALEARELIKLGILKSCLDDPREMAELIADRYEVFFRSVKVTAPGYSNVIDEATTKVEEASRAYVATRGRIGSLARAIGGCIGIKSNINLGIVVGIFGMVLGILLSATLALYASVARLSIVELMIYIGFWVVATIIAELIKRP